MPLGGSFGLRKDGFGLFNSVLLRKFDVQQLGRKGGRSALAKGGRPYLLPLDVRSDTRCLCPQLGNFVKAFKFALLVFFAGFGGFLFALLLFTGGGFAKGVDPVFVALPKQRHLGFVAHDRIAKVSGSLQQLWRYVEPGGLKAKDVRSRLLR